MKVKLVPVVHNLRLRFVHNLVEPRTSNLEHQNRT
jgi:hypothetical protein